MARKAQPKPPIEVDALKHGDDKRRNIPTAEYQSMVARGEKGPIQVAYERRNPDLDPQLVWRGKDVADWSDLVVNAPPVYIQEKISPKALIDDLRRMAASGSGAASGRQTQLDMFSDFNGIPEGADKTDFYRHDQNWSNRMILGDSLQVMASLAEREGLRGQVQCIYFDPPYGIKFNSNFQWSTTSRDVKDGNRDHITREPEQVKAFRDTWRDGIHSYLTYLRDRLTVARDLLTESGSIFVQIGDENVHRVRALMDEVFGVDNCICNIVFLKTSSSTSDFLGPTFDTILWYSKRKEAVKYRKCLMKKAPGQKGGTGYKSVQLENLERRSLSKPEVEDPDSLPNGSRIYFRDNLTSQSIGRDKGEGAASWFGVKFESQIIKPSQSVRWKTNETGFDRLIKSNRVEASSGNNLGYIRFLEDYPVYELTDVWTDTLGQNQFGGPKTYVVQTSLSAVQRCLLMATDPGDLVLDPTCGSGTTAYVAEQWGRRWITIDTSRVALALARSRLMGARYPFYLLADSPEGQAKEAEVSRKPRSTTIPRGRVRQGFVYERIPHIELQQIAKNAEIDVIWDRFEQKLAPLRAELTAKLPPGWLDRFRKTQKYTAEVAPEIQEWEIPRELPADWPPAAGGLVSEFWKQRIARQKEIDASIAARAEFEYLYDKPYADKKKVRVAGPFTVESLSPFRTLTVDENDDLRDPLEPRKPDDAGKPRFESMILDNLRTAGVQQAHKEGRITFSSLEPWPGKYVCARGIYPEGETERKAAIFIGPEFGTVQRSDLVAAAREASDGGFDVLVACAFNYEAHTTDFDRLGGLPVLKARMNADLHMAADLKNTGKGNLFVIFGEPDVTVAKTDEGQVQVTIHGVDVFKPQTGEVESSGPEGIACWFIDTDYDEESFFVRQAYFLGANDPYGALRTTLKAEISPEAWESLHSATSRPFDRPANGRIAVKVINHLGDEVMKVFQV